MCSTDRKQVKIVIVGAGAAGLAAANRLIEFGFDPNDLLILEARDRIGGRIYTTEETRTSVTGQSVDFCFDHGAAWLHGTGVDWKAPLEDTKARPMINPMVRLLQQTSDNIYETHLNHVFDGNPWMRPQSKVQEAGQLALYAGGELIDPSSRIVQAALQQHFWLMDQVTVEGHRMYNEGRGMETVATSLASIIERILESDKFAERLERYAAEDRNRIRTLTGFFRHLIECWYGDSADELQLCEFVEDEDDIGATDAEYTEEGDMYGPHCTLKNGMRSVLEPLLSNEVQSRVRLEEEVTKIRRCGSCLCIDTRTGLQVVSQACVVTLPIGCLQALPKLFEPKLGDDKQKAIFSTKMGNYKKVFLTFDSVFWPVHEAFVGMMSQSASPLGPYLLFDNLWARKGVPCLEAVLFGRSGQWATGKTDDVIRDAILAFFKSAMSLDELPAQCLDCHVTRWEEDPFSRGAYSSVALGASYRHVESLAKPEWGGALVMAGEATVDEFEGSVHAALMSGERAAEAVACYLKST